MMSFEKSLIVRTIGVVVLEFVSRIVPRSALTWIVPGLHVGVESIVSVAFAEIEMVSPFVPEMEVMFVSVVTFQVAMMLLERKPA
jgi:hypothetical protein